MREIILIAGEDRGLSFFDASIPDDVVGEKRLLSDNSLWVEAADKGFIKISKDNGLVKYYDSDEIDKMQSIIQGEPNFFLVNFKDVDTLKSLLPYIADHDDICVDNDNDLLISGSDFIRKLHENPDWNLTS